MQRDARMQGGPCAAARAVCGQARGCREVKTRAARVPLRPSGAASSPRPRARGNPLCACAPHSPAHFAGCAAREAGAGSVVRERGEPGATLRGRRSLPAAHRHLCACDRRAEEGARLGAKEMRRRSATASLRTGGYYQRTKIEQLVFQSREAGRGAGGMRLDRGPSPSRSASAARRARARSRKMAAARRGTDSRGGAPDARRKPTLFPRSSKRHAAPRARAGGHAARSSDCGGEAGPTPPSCENFFFESLARGVAMVAMVAIDDRTRIASSRRQAEARERCTACLRVRRRAQRAQRALV